MEAIVVDTETTGVEDPVPVEAAWLEVTIKREVGEQYREYFNPGKPILYGAMATHHILNEDLVDKRPFSEFRLPEVQYLIGHRVDFDWEAIGKPDCKRICTLALARRYLEIDSHTLGACLYWLDADLARTLMRHAHSAIVDVVACSHLLFHFITTLKIESFEQLWEISEDARIPRSMTFGKYPGRAIVDLPRDYVAWLLKQDWLDPYLRIALEARS